MSDVFNFLIAADIYRPVLCGPSQCEYSNQCFAVSAGFTKVECRMKKKPRAWEAYPKQVPKKLGIHNADDSSLDSYQGKGVIAGLDKSDKSWNVRPRPGKCPSVASGVMCSKSCSDLGGHSLEDEKCLLMNASSPFQQ